MVKVCERSGHSIDCILALISIWLDPAASPVQRDKGAEVFQLGGLRGVGGASRGRPAPVEAERRRGRVGRWGCVLC